MNLNEAIKAKWQREVEIAYATKAFCQNFDLYWAITSSLRTDSTVDWSLVRKTKAAMWEEMD